jgi:adenine-specific DNA-methyltransferase
VTGSTGLPPWREKQSDFCYGRRAASALRSLVSAVRARHIFLSYSEDGHIDHSEILSILGERGPTTFSERRVRRYRSNGLGDKSGFVHERIYHVSLMS